MIHVTKPRQHLFGMPRIRVTKSHEMQKIIQISLCNANKRQMFMMCGRGTQLKLLFNFKN